MFADKFKPPTKSDFLLTFYVVLGGFIGGIVLSILEGRVSATNLICGSVAGLIGVVLFNIDRSDWVRLFVAAILCGISWASVLETGKQFITVKAAESSSESAQKLANQLQSEPEAELSASIVTVTDTATRAVAASADVKSAPVQSRINEDLAGVVMKLNEVAPKEAGKVVEALSSLGSAAGRKGNMRLWKLSSDSLKKLSTDRALTAIEREKAVQAYEQLKSLE